MRATNDVLCSEASSSSFWSISVPVSEASSRVSSVTTGSAASVKWTNASEPSRVVLPHPEGHTGTISDPSAIVRSTARTACVPSG